MKRKPRFLITHRRSKSERATNLHNRQKMHQKKLNCSKKEKEMIAQKVKKELHKYLMMLQKTMVVDSSGFGEGS